MKQALIAILGAVLLASCSSLSLNEKLENKELEIREILISSENLEEAKEKLEDFGCKYEKITSIVPPHSFWHRFTFTTYRDRNSVYFVEIKIPGIQKEEKLRYVIESWALNGTTIP